ncbi:siderophore ABC transporter substrate-binding protein [Streptococcus hillyeri]|uniref:Ferrichrome ABC transporter substrate-binding protein n=1 Tax=Streptococcus hillyeri TaxID=2282420 RepID=A0A3L9DVK0_9STRE|nr:ABC transporter substrate-binding protein [Streptococcus hillyeri]RLY02800.1 ferrichrome ABC transporter substrate-binding protein [Streptococcus hillyeri]
MSKTMKRLLSAVALVATFILVACGSKTAKEETPKETKAVPAEVTIKAENGDITVPTNPKKIVVLDLGMADTLRALGHEDAIVGMPSQSLPTYLADLGKKDSVTNVGNLKEVNLEAIAELAPDVIIASGRTQGKIAEFEEIAPTVYFATDSADYLNSVKNNVTEVAKLFGDEAVKTAKKELAELDNIVSIATKANDGTAQTTLMVLLNEGNIAGIGSEGRYGFVYNTLGFKPTSLEIKEEARGGRRGGGHGQGLSFESIAEVNPDTIFVVDRTLAIGGDTSTNADVLNNALLQGTKAGQNKRIITLTSDLWYLSGGGLESTRLMFEEVAEHAGK